MPQWLFVREHARCGGDVATLCATFGSSIAATERRIASLFEMDPVLRTLLLERLEASELDAEAPAGDRGRLRRRRRRPRRAARRRSGCAR